MSLESTSSPPACSTQPATACSCGNSGCAGAPADSRRSRRTGLLAVGAVGACLVCLIPGVAVALAAAGIVLVSPLGLAGALVAPAVALVGWRLVIGRRARVKRPPDASEELS